MTVCIAARCDEGFIFCAADRMLTAGDIQYEPPSQKMFRISPSILLMMSGDSTFYTEIFDALSRDVHSRTEEEITALSVNEVVQLFLHHRNRAKLRRSEAAVLQPLGIGHAEFLRMQGQLGSALTSELALKLQTFDVPGIDVIVAGVDNGGAQIYVINDGNFSCYNAIGFAAVGSGAGHAESQFMLARHAWNSPLPDTLLLTYFAKKRAEVAPGVGIATDLLMIQPNGSISGLNEDLESKLEAEHLSAVRREQKGMRSTVAEMKRYVDELRSAATEPDEVSGDHRQKDAHAAGNGSEKKVSRKPSAASARHH